MNKKPLGINIIPSTSWYNNVRSNFSKEDWDVLRKACYKKAGYKCEICSGRGHEWPVECHEVWAFDDEKHIQKLVRLIALCPMCHRCQHPGKAGLDGFGDEIIRHYCKVNKVSIAETHKDYDKAWKVWQERSVFDWELDVSVLLTKGELK